VERCVVNSLLNNAVINYRRRLIQVKREVTNSIEQTPSLEAGSHSADQEMPGFLWNPKVHNRVHNSPPLDPILKLMNHVYTAQPISFEFNIRAYTPLYA
jgi:hypothetical protein